MLTLDTEAPLAVAAVQAIHTGDLETLRRLLRDNPRLATARLGGDPDRCGDGGMTRSLLHVATDWPGHFPNVAATITTLVAAGADVNARFTGPHTETPLHWAASSDDVAALDALLDAGADLEARGAVIAGGTPLTDAVAFAQWKAAHRLHDFDFHPDEPEVRLFTVPRAGVLRADEEAVVYEARYGDVVLRHYAFGSHWFKVNVTTDLSGNLVETGQGAAKFAFNCDISTPMHYAGDAVYAVDLFADILVREDAMSYELCDVDELAAGVRDGLVSPGEASAADRAISELTDIIDRKQLLPWLAAVCPFRPSHAPAALPRRSVPLAQVLPVRPAMRPTW